MDYTKLALHIKSELFDMESDGEDGWPIICDLHDSFEGELFDDSHNCLGCNFAHYTWGLLRTTQAWSVYVEVNKDTPPKLLEDFYPTSVMFHWLNTLVDAYVEILKIIELSEGRTARYFKCFKKIRMWANFFKHPKAMILTHHAHYTFDKNEAPVGSTVVDDIFIEKHYRNGGNNKALFDALTNRSDVFVLMPDLFKIISDFAFDTKHFIELLTNNELFKRELSEKTTFENFYNDSDIVDGQLRVIPS